MKHSGKNSKLFNVQLPIIHTRIEWSLFIQGLIVSLSTALALVPLLTLSFGLSFEEAIAMAMIHMLLVTSHVMIFGEPLAAGWITPALPFVLVLIASGCDSPTEKFQMMTALSLDFAALTFFMSITKLGKKFCDLIPNAFKAAIILGAALSAYKRIYYDDVAAYASMPITFSLAMLVCLIIFYLPGFQALKKKSKLCSKIASLGLLPAFIVAGVFGWLANELSFSIEMGFLIPPVGDLWNKVSPFAIGFPPLEYFLKGLPIAFMAYLVLFGDMLTGTELIRDKQHYRPDDPIEVNINKTHLVVSIRNFLMALIAPFFPTQGVLWAGAQVLVLNRWAQGKDKVESLLSGVSAFYYYGVPVMFFILPVLTFLRPFMPLALMLTLFLTAVACSKLALNMTKGHKEKTIMLTLALLLVFFDPWVGLVVGCAFYLLNGATKKFWIKR
ncbi:MAG: hypothetical protein P8J14_11690 [Emcibacteraceae bacterium]|nr:hypothetical protein [Emcibacteraceae bacterium]